MRVRVFASIALLACLPWIGGLLVLGAIVAPMIFNHVPPPTNADAMTLVFRRFDHVAIAASAIVLVCEVGLATVTRTLRDAARSLAAIVMSGLALYEGTMLSPQIEALHRAGAVRGVGELGLDLSHAHASAELLGKTELVLGLAYVVLIIWTVSGTRVAMVDDAERPKTARRASLPPNPDDGGAKLRRDEV